MPEHNEIVQLITDSVRQLAADFEIQALLEAGPETPLFGEGGALDSMALVNLIADVEEAVQEKWGRGIALADERAMSARRSPFRSVESLAKAVRERLES